MTLEPMVRIEETPSYRSIPSTVIMDEGDQVNLVNLSLLQYIHLTLEIT